MSEKTQELIGIEKGPGTTEKYLSRTPEGIRIEVAIRLYETLVAQAARGQRLSDLMAPALAEKAFKFADEFIKVWQHYD